MKPNIIELTSLTQEADSLVSKATLTKHEQRRLSFLTGTAIPAVKAGATLAEVNEHELNEMERRNGFRQTQLVDRSPVEPRAKAFFLNTLLDMAKRDGIGNSRELRTISTASTEGNLLSMIGSYTGLGYFVPTQMYDKVFATMKQHDFLYDPDKVTVINTTNAHPIHIPTFSDVDNVAVQVSETTNTFGAQVALANVNGSSLGAYSYRSPIYWVTDELFQDVAATANLYDVFVRFQSDRLARGIGAKLMTGSGTGTTLGLIPSLIAKGVTGVVATGSASNTGGSETGANSVGSQDLAALYFSVNAAYRNSPNCAFAMNDTTLLYLSKVTDKFGQPLIKLDGNGPTRLLGKPVYVSPTIPTIGSGSEAISILFGDFSYWTTRLVSNDETRVQVYRETGIEQGLVGLQSFVRADGTLAFTDSDPSNSPINYLVQHS